MEIKDEMLDRYIEAAADALQLPIDPEWVPTIKANLQVTLRLAESVAEFQLPDEAEPACVYEV